MASTPSIVFYSEIFTIEQKLRAKLNRLLPDDMELSHFSVLNHLVATHGECTPLQLAKALNVTKGAMTNTLSRLEVLGFVHIRKDWDDARRKHVSISQSGKLARDMALQATAPVFEDLSEILSDDELKQMLTNLRRVRLKIS